MVFVTLVKIFAKNHERVYSDIRSNRSYSKPETLLKRTECTFDLVSFLYHFLSRISKDFFQSPDKKSNLLYANTKKIFRNFEKQRIKLEIFVKFLKKKTFFYTLKQQWFILYAFYSFEGVGYCWVELCYFFFQVPSTTNHFFLRRWKRYRTGTFKPYSTPLWTIGVTTVTYTELWWSFEDLRRIQ